MPAAFITTDGQCRISIKELIQQGKLKGTIRFYGTPVEEAVGGKIYMQLRKDVRTEFGQRRNGHVFKPYIPDGPPPIPNETQKN